jgi:protein-S-isoprenylcysteine O-methyltransferase Ste14
MFGLVGACAVVGSKKVGASARLGLLIVSIFSLGRFVLPLPFCDQPRFASGGWHVLAGGVLFVVGGFLGLVPSLAIRPLNAAKEGMDLQTTGLYSVVRNPIYLGELLSCLGWAIVHRSIVGVALVPLWWASLLILVLIEEESLERSLGQTYLECKKRVRGRILPGLPI